jgi:UDP:flavonoid glycosyltransferase YjiC (YdhE family)
MVVVPLFADDQYANARRVQAVGAGVALQEGRAAAAHIRQALEDVLHDSAFRITAGRLADEIAGLPHPSESLAVLEAL